MAGPDRAAGGWQPPERPEWVERLNEEGRCMDIRAVIPLDEESLIDAAIRSNGGRSNGGLSDFGPGGWREPFSVFVRSLDEEADLNLTGRLRVRSEIIQILSARLQIEEAYRLHPEIEEEEISQPIIVLGQGRSGTSFLVNLLDAHPDNGSVRHWEALFPCPPPEAATYHSDPRIEKAHRLITQKNRITPTLTSMHDFSGYKPIECCVVIALNFMSPTWLSANFGQVPSFEKYLATQDIDRALLYHRRVLKLLQWRNPRKHWVLKDVLYLDWASTLYRLYPDALFVWPHRDAVRAQASARNMIGVQQWAHSDHPFKNASLDVMLNPHVSAARLQAAIDYLDSGAIPAGQIHHMLYRDLIDDPLGSVEKMYAHFGLPLTQEARAAMQRYLADNPRDARPPHRFAAGSDEEVAAARAAYQAYLDRFNIPVE